METLQLRRNSLQSCASSMTLASGSTNCKSEHSSGVSNDAGKIAAMAMARRRSRCHIDLAELEVPIPQESIATGSTASKGNIDKPLDEMIRTLGSELKDKLAELDRKIECLASRNQLTIVGTKIDSLTSQISQASQGLGIAGGVAHRSQGGLHPICKVPQPKAAVLDEEEPMVPSSRVPTNRSEWCKRQVSLGEEDRSSPRSHSEVAADSNCVANGDHDSIYVNVDHENDAAQNGDATGSHKAAAQHRPRGRFNSICSKHSTSSRCSAHSGGTSVSILSLNASLCSESIGHYASTERLRRRQNRNKYLETAWQFLDEPESSIIAYWFATIMPGLIMIGVVFSLLQAMLETPWRPAYGPPIDFVIDSLFSLEFLARFFVCPSWRNFFLSAYNMVDFLAGLPPLIIRAYCSYQGHTDDALEYVLLCLVPIARLLKLLRRFEKFNLLLSAFFIALEALPVLLYTLSVIILVFSALIYAVEPSSNIPSFNKAVWFTIVTSTTIGYGDTIPRSPAGEFIVSILVIASMMYMAMPLGIVGNAFSHVWEDRDRLLLIARSRDRLLQAGYEARHIPELFHLFDLDKDGELNWSEFNNMMSSMNIGINEERMMNLFRSLNYDGSAGIDDGEFVMALYPKEYPSLYGDA